MTTANDQTGVEEESAPVSREGSRHQGLLSSFAEQQFRWLFASNTMFFLGFGGQQVLRSWLVFQLTESEVALGLVSTAIALPMLLIAPLGGVIADRIDRRALVGAGQLGVILGEVAIWILMITGQIRFWHILVSAAVIGTAFSIVMPARQALVANAVGRGRLTNAMALSMAAVNTTRILGPAAAGLLIGVIGLNAAYGLNVVLFVLALACLAGVHAAPPPREEKQGSPLDNLKEGFAYLASDRLVLVLLFFGLIPMFLLMPFQNLLVLFAEEVWHVGATGLGTLSAVWGMGGLLGAVLVAWRSGTTKRLSLMMGSVFGFGSFLVAFALSPWYLLAIPMVFIASAFANLYSTLNNTAIQVLIPDKVRGRVSSFLMMSFSLPLLGTLPVSAMAKATGAPLAIATASGLAVLVALAFYVLSRPLRSLDQRLGRAFDRPGSG